MEWKEITKEQDANRQRTETITRFVKLEPTESIEGLYIDKIVSKQFGNESYKIKTDNGEILGVNSSQLLAEVMAGVPFGNRVKIVCNKKTQSKTSTHIYKEYSVFTAEA